MWLFKFSVTYKVLCNWTLSSPQSPTLRTLIIVRQLKCDAQNYNSETIEYERIDNSTFDCNNFCEL